MKRILKKITIYTLLGTLTFVTGMVIATFLYKDQLINRFIREANKSLNTPIEVQKISVSTFNNFPELTLVFDEVIIEESYTNSSYPLLEAERLEFTFNPLDLLEGRYQVGAIRIIQANCHFKLNDQGQINYAIFKSKPESGEEKVVFNLSQVFLEGVNFKYTNQLTSMTLDISAEEAKASLEARGNIYSIVTNGNFHVAKLNVANKSWVADKALDLDAEINYDDSLKVVKYSSSDFKLGNGQFSVNGDYSFKDEADINLKVAGRDTNIQTLLSLLGSKQQAKFNKYRSSGEVYFDLILNGQITKSKSPTLKVDFGLKKSELNYPESNVTISQASLVGNFTGLDISRPETYALKLREVEGVLENRDFKASLDYTNFNDPKLKLELEGDFDINSVTSFYDFNGLEAAEGDVAINMLFEGRLNDLKSKSSAANIITSGDILMKDLSLTLEDIKLPLSNLNGNLLFNNSDIALSEVSGYLGHSHFKLNGFFKNILAYLVFSDEPLGIESRLESDFIDLDELLSTGNKAENESAYVFRLAPRLRLKFNCNIKSLKFRRLHAKRILGDFKIKDQLALTDKLSFTSMGGKIDMAGLVDAQNQKDIKVNTAFTINDLDIDSIFYTFENFNQSFLEDKHLKGKVDAKVEASMDFDETLDLFAETLTSTISTSITGGQLNNFEPLQRLDKYLDEDGLSKLQFSELKNDIFIQNKTIFLPEMKVGTNVTDIKISGAHTFDQKIDYRIVAPLRSAKKIDKDEAFGAIEENVEGRSMLFLKIMGTTTDYRVVYDKQSVKKKIVSDLKKELQELKKAFKDKGLKKEHTVELEEDDYFDWDDDGNLPQ
ncbi:MAG: AsmA-like C-terminal region-containing protein [Fulvivirga sp.]